MGESRQEESTELLEGGITHQVISHSTPSIHELYALSPLMLISFWRVEISLQEEESQGIGGPLKDML